MSFGDLGNFKVAFESCFSPDSWSILVLGGFPSSQHFSQKRPSLRKHDSNRSSFFATGDCSVQRLPSIDISRGSALVVRNL